MHNSLKVKAMETKFFAKQMKEITDSLLDMTPAQREIVSQSIESAQTEITINELFQPILDNLSQCPHCHSSHFKKWGKAGKAQRYYCKNCHKTFNSKTKTPLANLHKSHIWEEYVQCMELKLSLREAASICNINDIRK
jgi:transposase-like protein